PPQGLPRLLTPPPFARDGAFGRPWWREAARLDIRGGARRRVWTDRRRRTSAPLVVKRGDSPRQLEVTLGQTAGVVRPRGHPDRVGVADVHLGVVVPLVAQGRDPLSQLAGGGEGAAREHGHGPVALDLPAAQAGALEV